MGFENRDFGSPTEDKKPSQEQPERDEKKEQYRLLAALRGGNTDIAYESKEFVSEDFIESKEVQEAAKEGVLVAAKQGDVDKIYYLEDFLGSSKKDFFFSEESQAAAKEGFAKQIRRKNLVSIDLSNLSLLEDKFDITKSPEVRQAIEEKFMTYLSGGLMEEADYVKKIFNIPGTFLSSSGPKKAIEEGFLSLIKEGNVNKIFSFSDRFQIPDEIFYSEEAKKAARGFILRTIHSDESNLNLNDIDALTQAFNIESDIKGPIFRHEAEIKFNEIKKTDPGKAEEFREFFGLPGER